MNNQDQDMSSQMTGMTGMTGPCDNQASFNSSFKSALMYTRNQNKSTYGVMMLVHLVFIVWAILLANKVPSGDEKVKHFLFAIIFPQIYVLAYYVSLLKK